MAHPSDKGSNGDDAERRDPDSAGGNASTGVALASQRRSQGDDSVDFNSDSTRESNGRRSTAGTTTTSMKESKLSDDTTANKAAQARPRPPVNMMRAQSTASIFSASSCRSTGGTLVNPALETLLAKEQDITKKHHRNLRAGEIIDEIHTTTSPRMMRARSVSNVSEMATTSSAALRTSGTTKGNAIMKRTSLKSVQSNEPVENSIASLSSFTENTSPDDFQHNSRKVPSGMVGMNGLAVRQGSKCDGTVVRAIRVGAHSRAMQKARLKRVSHRGSRLDADASFTRTNSQKRKLRSSAKMANTIASQRKASIESQSRKNVEGRERASALQLIQDDLDKHRKVQHDKEVRRSSRRSSGIGVAVRRLSGINRTTSAGNNNDGDPLPAGQGAKRWTLTGKSNKVAPRRSRAWSTRSSTGSADTLPRRSKARSSILQVANWAGSTAAAAMEVAQGKGMRMSGARVADASSSSQQEANGDSTNKAKRKSKGPPQLMREDTRKSLFTEESNEPNHLHLDVREQKKMQGQSLKWIILPDSPFRTRWDVGMLLLAMYYALSVPLRIAFQGTQAWVGVESETEQLIENVFMGFFSLDIALNFRTAMKVKGEYITDSRLIAKSYMRLWFFIDTIATVPVGDIISMSLSGGQTSSAAVGQLSKMLRLLRIFKVLRVFRVARILSRLEEVIKNPALIRLSKLVLAVVLVWHWVACLYWLVCDLEDFGIMGERWSREQGNEWVPMPRIWCVEYARCNESEWDLPGGKAERFGFNPYSGMHECFHHIESDQVSAPECPSDLTRQYLYALFFAIMATTGIGDDIKPVTLAEHVVSSVLIVLGVGMLAVILGAASSAISSVNASSSAWAEKYNRVDACLKDNRVPWDLRKRIMGYYSYRHARMQTEEKDQVFSKLHKRLDMELSVSLYAQRLSAVRTFKSLTREPSIMQDLIACMQPRIFIPQEFAFEQGDMGEDVFWIVDGSFAVYIDNPVTPIATLVPGDVFGELALLFRKPRNATVRAITHTDTVVLHRIQFQNVMCQVPRKLLGIMLDARQRGHELRIAERGPWARLRILVHATSQARVFGARVMLEEALMDPPDPAKAPLPEGTLRAGAGDKARDLTKHLRTATQIMRHAAREPMQRRALDTHIASLSRFDDGTGGEGGNRAVAGEGGGDGALLGHNNIRNVTSNHFKGAIDVGQVNNSSSKGLGGAVGRMARKASGRGSRGSKRKSSGNSGAEGGV